MTDRPRGRPRDIDAALSRQLIAVQAESGLGVRELVGVLGDAGVPSPRGSASWEPSTISRLLRSAGRELRRGRPPVFAPPLRRSRPSNLHVVTAFGWKRRHATVSDKRWRQLVERIIMPAHLAMVDAAFGGVRHAVIGAVAANRYMPQRFTSDIDFAIAAQDEAAAAAQLRAAGWSREEPLALNVPLTGWQWTTTDGATVDVLTVPGEWGEHVVTSAMSNRAEGVPMATLAHLVALKLVAGRAHDASDIQRMLGYQDRLTLAVVRAVAAKVVGADDLADLDQLIVMGQLEYGPPPTEAGAVDQSP